MKVLISGATGFIGRHLVARLSSEHHVFALVRAEFDGPRPASCSTVIADLRRPLDFGALPASVDVVVHLAQANVPFPDGADDLFAVNTAATQRLLEYARRAGARQFILASSGDVYGPARGPRRETEPPRPAGFYATTKYASELLVRAYDDYLKGCILRLFTPYGPGQVGRLIGGLTDRIRQGRPVRLHRDDRPRLTPIFVDDAVTAFERAMRLAHSDVLNVAGDSVVSVRELAEAIGRTLGAAPGFEATGEEAGDLMGDNRRMKATFGMDTLVWLPDGLARTLKQQEAATCQARA